MALAASAEAATYDLSSDFSNAANPNGVWSFTKGSILLSHYPQPVDSNTLNPAAANGYWGTGANFWSAPFVIQASQDGSATAPYSSNDFLTGDVIAHSTNPGSGDPLFINWTAPSAGVVNLTSSVWYGHSPVTRSVDISAMLGAMVLGTVTVNNAIARPNALTALSYSNLAVNAGDVLAFRFMASSGQQYGAIAGISEVIDFTPNINPPTVPEPATWAMLIAGFGVVGVASRRRRMRVES